MRKTVAKRQRPAEIPEGSSMLQWTDKYAPNRSMDLIIRKNKVKEFVDWLESKPTLSTTVCVLSGSSGSGKSTMIRVCAAELGMEVVEYIAKIQQQRTNSTYESKLEAYESFCCRAWMPALADTDADQKDPNNLTKKNTLVVLDDIPTVVGEDQERRLVRATIGLVSRSSKVVLAVTDISSKDTAEHYSMGGKWENSSIPKALTRALEKFCNPLTVSLNPIPKATMVKHLSMICDREGLDISKEDMHIIAEHSQGDLSSAVLGLQFTACGLPRTSGSRRATARRRNASANTSSNGPHASSSNQISKQSIDLLSRMVRDSSLSLFHGLGKLLYNKRLPYPDPSRAHNLEDRPPMDGFDPEDTVHASGMSGQSVTAFLHENILDFIDEEHVEDIAQCLDHLSLADVLSSKMDFTPYFGTAQDEPDGTRGMIDMLSSIVASRGICYWNAHPAPRSWKPLKAPSSFKVERGRRTNGSRLRQAASVNRIQHGGAKDQTDFTSMSVEILPYVRAMGFKDVRQLPQKWERYWQGKCVESENWRQDRTPTTAMPGSSLDDPLDEDPIEN